MLWYLLYPIRGTTRAPALAPDHPLRQLLNRYALLVARNVPVVLLVSVAVVTALIYPIPFLYSHEFSSGTSSIPHHVWTNAQPIKSGPSAESDVVMRSVWIHGDYMNAFDRDILLSALELQNELLGPMENFSPTDSTLNRHDVSHDGSTVDLSPTERDAFHIANGLTNQSWFFHSPFLYWSNSREDLVSDPCILCTVNRQKLQQTSANVTLRHTVVFSGKRFQDGVLVAADALVITLIHLRDSPIGRQWERKAAEIVSKTKQWTVYPASGLYLSSQLFEFQFLPLSFQDAAMLGLAYVVTGFYLLQYLRKIPAIKSRSGLMLTVMAQIFMSIMSSFTVCAILRIDLSRIPSATYPLVVIAMSLENMLRLIKGVILTNPEDSTSKRIGEAFGKNIHIALASVVEHLLLLWCLSNLVSSGLVAFCGFLAIAVLFDFFYLSTFFLSVLSVEVRRSELGDVIEKASFMRRTIQPSAVSALPITSEPFAIPPKSWAASMMQGRLDLSTRVAGTVVMLGFLLIAQWHFFASTSFLHTLGRLLKAAGVGTGAYNTAIWDNSMTQLKAVNQVRSPLSWIHQQDHATAHEVISVVKPWAHSYIAKVYEPLVFVMNGADRMPSVTEPLLLPAVYDFVRHQTKPFLLAILLTVAAIRVFIKYLLWDEKRFSNSDASGGSTLSIKTLEYGHSLDVALLSASSDGLVVSVGLDRLVRVWNIPFNGMNYLLSDHDSSWDVPFPVLAIAIDRDSIWLAILSTSVVAMWNLSEKVWGPSITIDLYGQRHEAFFFVPSRKFPWLRNIVVVRRNGTLMELDVDSGKSMDYPICRCPLVCATPIDCSNSISTYRVATSFVTASRNGCIHRVTPVGDGWLSEEVKQQAGKEDPAHSLVALPLFSAYLVVRSRSVDLVDLCTSMTIHTFTTSATIKARSLEYLYGLRWTTQRNAPELTHFSLVYTNAEGGNCVVQTYMPQKENGVISFFTKDQSSRTPCATAEPRCKWKETRQVTREVPNPGKWKALPNGCVIGVRQRRGVSLGTASDSSSGRSITGYDTLLSQGTGVFQRRGRKTLSDANDGGSSAPNPTQKPITTESSREGWEAWSVCSVTDNAYANGNSDQASDMSNSSSYITQPLKIDKDELLVEEPGPITCIGAGTIALGMGASVKVITMGQEQFGNPAEMLEAAAGQLVQSSRLGGRRRKHRLSQKSF